MMADRSDSILDRDARRRKLKKLKIAVAVAGLAGTGVFTGLAVEHTQASSGQQPAAATPAPSDQGSFFSTQGTNPPSSGDSAPQTSSGGS
jgi:hypothetical protein